MHARYGVLLGLIVCIAAPAAWATNGDNLIGVGPVSRAMGGVGVAAPQDSISAIFINPAAMDFCPCGEQSEAILGATVFDPTVETTVRTPFGTSNAKSQHKAFIIPAAGVNSAINDKVRFGIGAFGVSGLGADYRNSGIDLDGDPSNGFEGDVVTRLEVMRFAPMASYRVNQDLSLGLAAQLGYNNLDLGNGSTHDYSLGVQLGALYAMGMWQFGASYASPQKSSHARIANFDAFTGDMYLDTLDLESPAAYIIGAAVQPRRDFLAEIDLKYYDWKNADGYKDFDWDSQWVVAIGAQYHASDKLYLRAGYNYGENPVQTHDGFDPGGVTTIQGKSTPTLGYEYLRIVGFPAIVENHLTVGLGYQLTDSLVMNLDYMHAFEKEISETSAGDAFSLTSSLSEDSLGFSFAWQFE